MAIGPKYGELDQDELRRIDTVVSQIDRALKFHFKTGQGEIVLKYGRDNGGMCIIQPRTPAIFHAIAEKYRAAGWRAVEHVPDGIKFTE